MNEFEKIAEFAKSEKLVFRFETAIYGIDPIEEVIFSFMAQDGDLNFSFYYVTLDKNSYEEYLKNNILADYVIEKVKKRYEED